MQAITHADLDEIAWKALNALARRKYMMFGYYASIWVYQNRCSGLRQPSPFTALSDRSELLRIAYE